jgi:hypothetical protein
VRLYSRISRSHNQVSPGDSGVFCRDAPKHVRCAGHHGRSRSCNLKRSAAKTLEQSADMASDRDKDDIAAALHGLHSGEHGDTAHGEEVTPTDAPVAPAPKTPSVKPPAAKRAAAPAPRPASPSAPVSRHAPAPARPSSGSSSRQRPSAPTARPAQPTVPAQAPEPDVAIEDDTALDATTAPALDYRGPTVRPTRRKKTPFFKTLGFRQTMIPVLLSTGLMMIVLGVAHWVVDEEAQLALVPAAASATLTAVGALLILLGVANMLFVRNELAQGASAKASSAASASR